MKPPEPCIRGRCHSPLACNGFGYCRERNIEHGLPSAALAQVWRDEAVERSRNAAEQEARS